MFIFANSHLELLHICCFKNMAFLLRRLLQMSNTLPRLPASRSLATSRVIGVGTKNYDGDGRTTVSILNRDFKHLIMIDAVSDHGFRLNNGIFVLGPVAVFPRTVLQWNIADINSITPESLSLFGLLEPKLDIFVVGTGDKRVLPRPEVLKFFKEKKISLETLDTEKACSIFNFLNVEGRCVAGAFVPLTKVNIYESDVIIDPTNKNLGDCGYLM